jgi:hypothetical protein
VWLSGEDISDDSNGFIGVNVDLCPSSQGSPACQTPDVRILAHEPQFVQARRGAVAGQEDRVRASGSLSKQLAMVSLRWRQAIFRSAGYSEKRV